MAFSIFRQFLGRRTLSFLTISAMSSACGFVGLEREDVVTHRNTGGTGAASSESDKPESTTKVQGKANEEGLGGMGGDPNEAFGGNGSACALDSSPCRALSETLVHRYSFEGVGTSLVDSKGNSTGVVEGTQLSGDGFLALSGDGQYVRLPSQMVSVLGAVSLEVWFTWNGGDWWQRLFDFGSLPTTDSERPDTYLYATVHGGGQDFLHDELLAGISHEQGQAMQAFLQTRESTPTAQLTQVVLVVNDLANEMSLYRDGTLRAHEAIDIRLDEIKDEYAYLGHSLFSVDPDFHGVFFDFRIYDGVLTPEAIQLSFDLGPDAKLPD